MKTALNINGMTLLSALFALTIVAVFFPMLSQHTQHNQTQNVQLMQLNDALLAIENLGAKIAAMPQRFKTENHYEIQNIDQNFIALNCQTSACNEDEIARYDILETLNHLQQLGFRNIELNIQCAHCQNIPHTYQITLSAEHTGRTKPYRTTSHFIWK